MSKTRQSTQLRPSDTYTDTLGTGLAALQTAASSGEFDYNAIRSQVNKLIHGIVPTGGEHWYDAVTARGVIELDSDLSDLEGKTILCRVSTLADIVVGGGANVVTLASPGQVPTEVSAIGAVTTSGAITAQLAGAVGTGNSSVVVPGQNALAPKNLCVLVDTATGDVVSTPGGDQVYGLLQGPSTATNGNAFDNGADGVQISLVVVNAGRNGFDLTTAAAGLTIEYGYVARSTLESVPEECFAPWPGGLVDQAAAVDVTRQNAYDNQGTSTVTVATNATVNLAATRAWRLRDSLSANMFVVTEATSVQVAGAALIFDVDAPIQDFDGTTFDVLMAGAVSLDAGATSNFTVSAGNISVGASAGNASLSAGQDVDITSGTVLDVNAGTNMDVDVAGTFDLLSGGTFSIDGTGASNITVTTGTFTVSTETSGNLDLLAADAVNITAGDEPAAAGNSVNVTSGSATGGNNAGGEISVIAGGGSGTGAGGTLVLNGGAGGSTAGSIGGNIDIVSGPGSASGTGTSGDIRLLSGVPGSTTGDSGSILVGTRGAGSISGNSGPLTLGTGDVNTGSSGDISIAAGDVTVSGLGGAVTVAAGASSGNNVGGAITLAAGNGGGTSGGGDVSIIAGAAPGVGAGGDITLSPGTSSSGILGAVTVRSAPASTAGDIVLRLLNTGTTDDVRQYVTAASPIGNITGNPGDIAYRASGTLSTMYIHNGAVPNNTDWVQVGTGSGGGGTLEVAVEDTGATDANMDQSFDWRITDADTLSFSNDAGTNNLLSLNPRAIGDLITIGDVGDSAGGLEVRTARNLFFDGAAFDTESASTRIQVGLHAGGGVANTIDFEGTSGTVQASAGDLTLQTIESEEHVIVQTLGDLSNLTIQTAGNYGDIAILTADGIDLESATGSISLICGDTGVGDPGNGGNVTIKAGNAAMGESDGLPGSVTITGGNAHNVGTGGFLGGKVVITGGICDDQGGGDVTITSGAGLAGTNASAGPLVISAGASVGSVSGTDTIIKGGPAGITGLRGGNVVVQPGLETAGIPGYLFVDADTSLDNEHIVELSTGGTNGSSAQMLVGTRDPGAASIAAMPSSLYFRNTQAVDGIPGALWINTSDVVSEGTTWTEVGAGGSSYSETVGQFVPGAVSANTDILLTSLVDLGGGTIPTSVPTGSGFVTRVVVSVNGLEEINSNVTSSTAGSFTCAAGNSGIAGDSIQFGYPLFATDVVKLVVKTF